MPEKDKIYKNFHIKSKQGKRTIKSSQKLKERRSITFLFAIKKLLFMYADSGG